MHPRIKTKHFKRKSFLAHDNAVHNPSTLKRPSTRVLFNSFCYRYLWHQLSLPGWSAQVGVVEVVVSGAPGQPSPAMAPIVLSTSISPSVEAGCYILSLMLSPPSVICLELGYQFLILCLSKKMSPCISISSKPVSIDFTHAKWLRCRCKS